MKKKKMLLIVITLFLVAIAIMLTNFYPLLFMKPVATGVITNTEVLAVKDRMGTMYAIQSDEGYILIDAGSDVKALEKTLQQENISTEIVKSIFLTHSDADHVAAVSLFLNASVYMSEDELQMVNGEIKQGKNNSNSILNSIGLNNIMLLEDEQEVTIGEHTIKGIKAPGHTTGSMAYLVDKDYLFTGDCFRVSNNKLLTHPFTRDEQLSEVSIRRLYDIIGSTKLTFTTHYGYYKSNALKID